MGTENEYWKKRFQELEEEQYQNSVTYYKDLQEQFRRAKNRIQMDIEHWYQRLADNHGISLAAAKRLLKKDELDEFHWTVEEYIKKGEENAIHQRWKKELENASVRQHISYLEAMKLQVQQHAELLFTEYEGGVTDFLHQSYANRYYRSAYEIAKGTMVGSNLAELDEHRIDKILKKPWAQDGVNFSDRIWTNKDKLINNLHTELSQSIIRGEDPKKAINNLAHTMNVSKAQAGRLIMTESAAIAAAAQEDCFHDLDIEKFEIVVTFDRNTCRICQDMDGKIFDMKEFEVGLTVPPYHPNCRCCEIPYFDDEFTERQQRAARDEEGKTYYVPSHMNYSDWKKKYVNHSKADLNQVSKDAMIKTDQYVFVEAKTIKEANKYAQEVLGVKADYKGCDIRSANEWNKGVTEYFNQFEELKYNFGFIGNAKQRNRECKKLVYEDAFEKLRKMNPNGREEILKKYAQKEATAFMHKMRVSKDTFAQSWTPEGLLEEYRGICLNSDWGKNSNVWIQALIKNVELKFHPVGCDTIRSVLDHEMGHQFDELLHISGIKKIRDLFDIRGLDELTNDLSEYSWNNNNPNRYGEMIAEAWSEYCNNPNPREIAQTVGETI